MKFILPKNVKLFKFNNVILFEVGKVNCRQYGTLTEETFY